MTSGTATQNEATTHLAPKRQFSPNTTRELEALLKRYPTKRAALLPALRLLERDFGCVDAGGMRLVAELLDLTPSFVLGVFSFYTHYRRPGEGKYILEVCRTLPCALRGADSFAGLVAKKLGLRPGETSKDGRITLKDAECMAACDLAPVCQVNGEYHGNLTPEKFDKLVETLK